MRSSRAAGTGTYAGYETEQMEVPAEIYVKAPNQMATIAKSPAGVSVKAFDGRNGWRLRQTLRRRCFRSPAAISPVQPSKP